MDECWQFITGAGENEDKTPLVSAQREAFEKAGISSRMHFTELETKCSNRNPFPVGSSVQSCPVKKMIRYKQRIGIL